MKRNHFYNQSERGMAVIVGVIFFLLISTGLMFAVANPIADQIRASKNYVDAAQSYVSAETLNDDALYRLNRGLSLPSTLSLTLNSSTATATVSDFGGSKQIISTGIDNTLTRSVKSLYTETTGVSFFYGLLTGTGGFNLTGGAGINGNVFSNGNIIGTNGTFVTGAASVANISDPVINQTNGTSTTPSHQIDFGGTPVWNDVKPNDAAQGFQVTSNTPLTAFRIYLKKNNGNYIQDITVKIVSNSSGNPSNSSPLATATLSASLVGTSFEYETVSFATPPTLTPGTQYWIVLDTPSTSWNTYYSWAASLNTYANGIAKTGDFGGTWNATSPSTLDAYFDLYLGGMTGLMTGVTVGSAGGNAYAHEIRNATINNTAYCQISSGSTNKSCNTTQADPSQIAMPITDSQITAWKDDGNNGTIRNSSWSLGSNTSTSTSGAMKINGDLTIGGGATLTINGTLYVTGNINLNGAGRIRLGTSYGTNAGVIVVDGTTNLSGGAYITGNGNTGSYAILVSTNTLCATGVSCGSGYAISATGGTGSVVLVAQNGGIQFTGGASAKSAVGNYMNMSGGTILNYESGLADVNFSSGPSGAWSVNSWKEIVQ